MSDEATWRRRVDEWHASALPATTFTEGRGYSASALRYWAKRLESLAPARPVRIARLVRDGDTADAGGAIGIEIGGVRLKVGPGFYRATLRGVLEVLAELGTAR